MDPLNRALTRMEAAIDNPPLSQKELIDLQSEALALELQAQYLDVPPAMHGRIFTIKNEMQKLDLLSAIRATFMNMIVELQQEQAVSNELMQHDQVKISLTALTLLEF